MSVLKLAKIINTNEVASRKFQEEKWRRGFGCEQCGSIKAWKHRKLKNGLQKYRCEDCKHVFSDQSQTLLRWNKLNLRKIGAVAHLCSSKLSIREVAKECEVSKRSAERLKKLVRTHNGKLYETFRPRKFSGIVEMDETKMSGEWFWGIWERSSGRAAVEFIPNRSEIILARTWAKYLEEDSTVMTDELASYYFHPRYFNHFSVNHSKYYVHPECPLIHTNSIEGLWRQLKRKIHHFCNGVKLEHIQSYINEYLYLKSYHQVKKPSFFPFYCRK